MYILKIYNHRRAPDYIACSSLGDALGYVTTATKYTIWKIRTYKLRSKALTRRPIENMNNYRLWLKYLTEEIGFIVMEKKVYGL